MQAIKFYGRLTCECFLLAIGFILFLDIKGVYSFEALGNSNETTPVLMSSSTPATRAWQSVLDYCSEKGWNNSHIYAFGSLVAHHAVAFPIILVMHVIEKYNLFEEYKIQGSAVAPPSPAVVKKAYISFFVECFISTPVFAYFSYYYVVAPYTSLSFTADSIPTASTFMLHLFLSFLWNETWFYWLHRLNHHRLLYKHIHKVHHEFKNPRVVSSEYAHPLEQLVVNVLPTVTGPMILGSHVTVLWVFIALRLIESMEGHCGYDFPFSPFRLVKGARRHDFHHSHSVGCYGETLMFWDWFCGTDAAFKAFEKKQLKKA